MYAIDWEALQGVKTCVGGQRRGHELIDLSDASEVLISAGRSRSRVRLHSHTLVYGKSRGKEPPDFAAHCVMGHVVPSRDSRTIGTFDVGLALYGFVKSRFVEISSWTPCAL